MEDKPYTDNIFFNPLEDVAASRRNLPHWHQDGVMYFVTFRLADSLPKGKMEQLEDERKDWLKYHNEPYTNDEWVEYYELFSERIEKWLDAGIGSCYLSNPDVASIVGNALRFFDRKRYTLDEWIVMPNHVHVLLVPLAHEELSKILHSWKSFTATKVNKLLRQATLQLWMHESYDHIVRNQQQLTHYRKYIRDNPEKAHVSVTQASWIGT